MCCVGGIACHAAGTAWRERRLDTSSTCSWQEWLSLCLDEGERGARVRGAGKGGHGLGGAAGACCCAPKRGRGDMHALGL